MRYRRLFLSVLYLLLAASAFHWGYAVWMLFAVLGSFQIWRLYFGERAADDLTSPTCDSNVVFGKLGLYQIEKDDETEFGLFSEIAGVPVFIQIRRDCLEIERSAYAHDLHKNASLLQSNLSAFRQSHPEFKGKSIHAIGVFGQDPRSAEVFWVTGEHSSLQGFQFLE